MSIQLTFHGAAGDVTGSAYLLETSEARVLVDFGMFQSVPDEETLNRLPSGIDPARLDAVLLTHGHLDHTGRLPLLTKAGYSGPVFCTEATVAMTGLILRDSARVQAQDLTRVNRKRERAGEEPLEPLYGPGDVDSLLQRCQPVPYQQMFPVAPGIQAVCVEAGHMLGSASLKLYIRNGDRPKTVVFSGDIGPTNAPILKDPEGFSQADVVILESTYGDRDHKPLDQTIAEFERVVRRAVESRGKLLVPTFAVGRAQLLIYLLALMFRRQVVPPFPMFLDSPMAIEATEIYQQHFDLLDEEFQAIQRARPLIEDLRTLQATPTADQSKAINDVEGPSLVLAGSGMCNAGRILHHLKQNLWRPQTHVLIVGYQANGTLGRLLVEGVSPVKIFGEKIAVRAKIHTLGGFSAHAGQSALLHWFRPLAGSRPQVILTHGEERARRPLAALIRQQFGLDCELPTLGQTVAL